MGSEFVVSFDSSGLENLESHHVTASPHWERSRLLGRPY